MKCAKQGNTPCGNIIDLISSVNTLIDNMSERADDMDSDLIDRSASNINKQLKQLERLFATKQKKLRRRGNKRQISSAAAPALKAKSGACSRSPCSNCTSSNCNIEGSYESRIASRRYTCRRGHSVSATSTTESGYSRKCVISTSLFPIKTLGSTKPYEYESQPQKLQQHSMPSPMVSDPFENSSNHRQSATSHHRKTPQMEYESPAEKTETEHVDFAYLKSGLAERWTRGPAVAVKVEEMEHAIQEVQQEVDGLRRMCELQSQQHHFFGGRQGDCGHPEQLKAEIRRVQARVSALHSQLHVIIGVEAAVAQSCRHRGSASEQARDPLSDIRCKYERSLLYGLFDVKWPFLHIVAPRPIDPREPAFCSEN